MFLLTITSLIFGSFSGWLAGDNRGTLLGRMIAFSAFVAISGLFNVDLRRLPRAQIASRFLGLAQNSQTT